MAAKSQAATMSGVPAVTRDFGETHDVVTAVVQRWLEEDRKPYIRIRDQRVTEVSVGNELTYEATFLIAVTRQSHAADEAIRDAIAFALGDLASGDITVQFENLRVHFSGEAPSETYVVDLRLTVSGPGSKPMVW